MLAAHDINAKQSELDKLGRKLHNLMLMRVIAFNNDNGGNFVLKCDGILSLSSCGQFSS